MLYSSRPRTEFVYLQRLFVLQNIVHDHPSVVSEPFMKEENTIFTLAHSSSQSQIY